MKYHLALVSLLSFFFVSSSSSITYQCEEYDSSVCGEDKSTNNAKRRYGSCYFSACGGQNVVVSNYQNCDGNSLLRLYDNDGNELSFFKDVYWDYRNLDNCSEISFSLPSSIECKKYESRVGCGGNGDCSAHVYINVTDQNKEYVKDVIKSPVGDTWNQACPFFNVSGSSIYYDPSQTSVCSFELCPKEYYRAFLRKCTHDAVAELFSYSDVQYTNYNLACQDNEDDDKVQMLYFDTIGNDNCRLFSFYQFCDTANPNEWCTGQVVLTKYTFPRVNVTWSNKALNSKVGDVLDFTLGNMSIEYDYWNYGEVSFWVVAYKTDMLKNQKYCGFRDYSSNDFYDFIWYFEWFLIEGAYTLKNIHGEDYVVSNFGGNYTVVLYAWSDAFHAVEEISRSENLYIPPRAQLRISIHEFSSTNENDLKVSGMWKFSGDSCADDDILMVLPVDHEGYCGPHDVNNTLSSALFYEDLGSTYKGSSTGTFEFTIPHCDEFHSDEVRYEIVYMRNSEVIDRIFAANESVTSAHISGDDDSFLNKTGLEHLVIFLSLVGFIAFAVTIGFIYSRAKSKSGYGGLSCVSSHDDEIWLNSDVNVSAHNPVVENSKL